MHGKDARPDLPLPPDVVVERRGAGEDRHVFLKIESNDVELRADEAKAIGWALVRAADLVEGDDGGRMS